MSSATSKSLASFAIQITKHEGVALIYFGDTKHSVVKANLDVEFPGVLVCVDTDDDDLLIALESIIAVKTVSEAEGVMGFGGGER